MQETFVLKTHLRADGSGVQLELLYRGYAVSVFDKGNAITSHRCFDYEEGAEKYYNEVIEAWAKLEKEQVIARRRLIEDSITHLLTKHESMSRSMLEWSLAYESGLTAGQSVGQQEVINALRRMERRAALTSEIHSRGWFRWKMYRRVIA